MEAFGEKPVDQERIDRMLQVMDPVFSYASEHQLTSEDVFLAYEIAMRGGFADMRVRDDAKEEILQLAKIIDELLNSGVATNHFATAIEALRNHEDVGANYERIIEELNTSDREKAVLNTIIGEQKVGKLVLTSGEADFEYDLNAYSSVSRNEFASVVAKFLTAVGDLPVEVQFEEE